MLKIDTLIGGGLDLVFRPLGPKNLFRLISHFPENRIQFQSNEKFISEIDGNLSNYHAIE